MNEGEATKYEGQSHGRLSWRSVPFDEVLGGDRPFQERVRVVFVNIDGESVFYEGNLPAFLVNFFVRKEEFCAVVALGSNVNWLVLADDVTVYYIPQLTGKLEKRTSGGRNHGGRL